MSKVYATFFLFQNKDSIKSIFLKTFCCIVSEYCLSMCSYCILNCLNAQFALGFNLNVAEREKISLHPANVNKFRPIRNKYCNFD